MTPEQMASAARLLRQIKSNQEVIGLLETSKALSESALDQIPVLLMMLDTNKRVLKLNKYGQQVLQMTEPEALGRSLEVVLDSDIVHSLFEALATKLSTDGVGRCESNLEVGGEVAYFHWAICRSYSDAVSGRTVYMILGSDATAAKLSLELHKDLEVAKVAQTLLLPSEQVVERDYFRMAGYYESSAQVGGDLWWYREQSDDVVLTVLADVMGHGAGSAMVTAGLAGCLVESCRSHPVLNGEDLSQLVMRLEGSIFDLFQGRYMIVMCSFIVHRKRNEVLMVRSGFPANVIYRKDGKRKVVQSPGEVIGIGALKTTPDVLRLDFNEGDRLVLFTDGCYEFESKKGKQFGRRAFCKLLESERDQTPKVTCENVGMALRDAYPKNYADDDITFLVFDRL